MINQHTDKTISLSEVIERTPVFKNYWREYKNIVSPFDLLYFYIRWEGVRVSETGRYITGLLNEDKVTLLLHVKGESFDGQLKQSIEGVPYNDNSVIEYIPFKVGFYFEKKRITEIEVNHVRRPEFGGKHHVRFASVWGHPILVLDENNGPCAGGCKFCCKPDWGIRPKINTQETLQDVLNIENIDSLAKFAEITIVTSLFLSDQECEQYMEQLIEALGKFGFNGIVTYIGCQLNNVEFVKYLVRRAVNKGMELQYLYTIEKFFHRTDVMKPLKAKMEFGELTAYMETLADALAPKMLGYNYVLGLESLTEFKTGLMSLYKTGAVPNIHPLVVSGGETFEFEKSMGNNAFKSYYPKTGYVENKLDFILEARKILYELYKNHDPYYLQNNSGLMFFFPGEPQYLHGVKFIKFNIEKKVKEHIMLGQEIRNFVELDSVGNNQQNSFNDLKDNLTEVIAVFP